MNKSIRKIMWAVVALASAAGLTACNDDTSQIGSVLTEGEVNISVDESFKVTGEPVYTPSFDSRTATKLLGRINVPEYGELRCSFVSQMLAAGALTVPDSIDVNRVDSMRMELTVTRGALTGDSLAPQQISLYALTKQLPSNLDNTFSPEGYYARESLMGRRTFTLSALAMGDSAFKKAKSISIPIRLPIEYARKVFTDYRTNPAVFQWPNTFNQYLPGIYAESSFGSGCMANINKVTAWLYWHHFKTVTTTVDGVATETVKTVRDSVAVFATAPEVLSSNCVTLKISDALTAMANAGKNIVVAPAGYNVKISLPLSDIIKKYSLSGSSMTVINDLTLSIPASVIDNDYGITPPPALAMIPVDEVASFFDENKVPDDETTFWASYNAEQGKYSFGSLRAWLINKVKEGGNPDEMKAEFMLVPVAVTTQMKQISYSESINIVTSCTPYMVRPSMGVLDLDNAELVFTYSSQIIK